LVRYGNAQQAMHHHQNPIEHRKATNSAQHRNSTKEQMAGHTGSAKSKIQQEDRVGNDLQEVPET